MRNVWRFITRHKRTEEAAAEAITADVVWTLVKRAGIFAAGVASAATVATLTTSVPTYHPTFSLSVKGAAFLTRNEGVRYSPYNDPFNCTVGVGHLIHLGPCTSQDYVSWRITAGQATALLMRDASSAVDQVRTKVSRPIDQPQFDALVDFTFNVGGGGLSSSSVLRDVNDGALQAVPSALDAWSYANGTYLPGLRTRRVAEGTLFTTGNYGPGIGSYTPPVVVPPAVAKLRAATGYWSWLAWRLGEGKWKHYKPQAASVRPDVPARIPAVWWRKERAYLAARHKEAVK